MKFSKRLLSLLIVRPARNISYFLSFNFCNRQYNNDQMKNFLKNLINAESTAAVGEAAVAKVVASEFTRSSIKADIDLWNNNRANVIARIGSGGSRGVLLVACHLDVVPAEGKWQYPPFGAVENAGRIYGRGSTDMKAGIVCTVTAIRRIVETGVKLKGDIVFIGCAGEETDSAGAERFVRNYNLPKPAGIIIPEPTDFAVVTAHRGLLWLEITTKGKAAHSSRPELGVNAILSMHSVLNELERFKPDYQPNELLGGSSLSVNTISGGNAPNIVPDKCVLGIDIRTVPGQNEQDIIAGLKEIFARLKSQNPQFEADVAVTRKSASLQTDNRCDFVRNFCRSVGIEKTSAVGFTTDGPCFASLDAPIVIFGPGKPLLCHQPDEYIEISDLEKGVEYYEKIIRYFLT
jgi:succinyl-diaminopimelate desuccinylase